MTMNANPTEPQALQLPGIDVAVGLENVGGDQGFYLRLVERFFSSQRGAMAALLADAAGAQWASLSLRAHTLRGSAAAIGADELARAAGTFEHALTRSASDAGMEPLCEALNIVMSGLELYFASRPATVGARPADVAQGSAARVKLLAQLAEHSGDALDTFDESRDCLALILTPETVQQLMKYLHVYDFDNARRLLC